MWLGLLVSRQNIDTFFISIGFLMANVIEATILPIVVNVVLETRLMQAYQTRFERGFVSHRNNNNNNNYILAQGESLLGCSLAHVLCQTFGYVHSL